MRLSVVTKQVKGTLDIRYLLRIEARLVIIPFQMNDVMYCHAENIASLD